MCSGTVQVTKWSWFFQSFFLAKMIAFGDGVIVLRHSAGYQVVMVI